MTDLVEPTQAGVATASRDGSLPAMHADEVLRIRRELEAAGVEYVFGAYVDIHGVPKSKCVPIGGFEGMAAGSELYTVGALEGMGTLGPNEDECLGVPDLSKITILPWAPQYAVAPAELLFHGKPYSHDSRRVLRRQVDAAAAMGYRFIMGIEPELYVLRNVDGQWKPFVPDDEYNLATRGYDLETTILAEPFLRPMVDYMTTLGWGVFSFDHEGGDGQYEFDFDCSEGLEMADRMIIFRLMAKHVARSLGCVATFMPKPTSETWGSGSHINVSLADLDSGMNAFEGARLDGGIGGYSGTAYRFTAGVLRHAPAITALASPTVNSYKRLLPRGLMNEISWAPVYRAFGHNNRTLMCRLPMNRRCLEVRTVDSACNFYLGAALILAAGLEGIREELDPPASVEYDTYLASAADLARGGVERLPRTLGEALDGFEADDLAKAVLGEPFHATFAEVKRKEWDDYNTVVSEWERAKYLHLL